MNTVYSLFQNVAAENRDRTAIIESASYYRCNSGTVLKNGTYPIGTPVLGAKICILDADGNSLPDGETGEICITGRQTYCLLCLSRGGHHRLRRHLPVSGNAVPG